MIPVTVCLRCKHYNGGGKCEAFKTAIPRDILFKGNNHTTKHPDQKNDIVFEEKSQGNA